MTSDPVRSANRAPYFAVAQGGIADLVRTAEVHRRVEESRAPTSVEATRTRALLSRHVDFWLLGGASIVLWVVLSALDPLRAQSWAVAHHFNNLAALSASLALLVNYPHFMASYALGYSRGWSFTWRHAIQLLLVPIALAGLLATAYTNYENPVWGRWLTESLAAFTHAIGLQAPFGQGETAGRELLGLLINVMFFTVGWHYSKQTFGCMMVYASYDGYHLGAGQRRLLKGSLFTIWAASYTQANLGTTVNDYYGAPYLPLGLPSWTYPMAMAFFGVGLVATLGGVGWRNYRADGRLPSRNFLVPYVAFMVWWLPPLVQPEFFLLAVPFFHSLQYLPFVYKVKRGELEARHPKSVELRGTTFVLGLIVAGFVVFELAPNTGDTILGNFTATQAWLLFICTQLFINIHHYFIDSAIWRFKSRQVREYLLA